MVTVSPVFRLVSLLVGPLGMPNSMPPYETEETLAYVYGHADLRDAAIAKSLTLDEARRIDIAKLPNLLWR